MSYSFRGLPLPDPDDLPRPRRQDSDLRAEDGSEASSVSDSASTALIDARWTSDGRADDQSDRMELRSGSEAGGGAVRAPSTSDNRSGPEFLDGLSLTDTARDRISHDTAGIQPGQVPMPLTLETIQRQTADLFSDLNRRGFDLPAPTFDPTTVASPQFPYGTALSISSESERGMSPPERGLDLVNPTTSAEYSSPISFFSPAVPAASMAGQWGTGVRRQGSALTRSSTGVSSGIAEEGTGNPETYPAVESLMATLQSPVAVAPAGQEGHSNVWSPSGREYSETYRLQLQNGQEYVEVQQPNERNDGRLEGVGELFSYCNYSAAEPTAMAVPLTLRHPDGSEYERRTLTLALPPIGDGSDGAAWLERIRQGGTYGTRIIPPLGEAIGTLFSDVPAISQVPDEDEDDLLFRRVQMDVTLRVSLYHDLTRYLQMRAAIPGAQSSGEESDDQADTSSNHQDRPGNIGASGSSTQGRRIAQPRGMWAHQRNASLAREL